MTRSCMHFALTIASGQVDINEAEPQFLKGHTARSGQEMSPIRVVKNPDGSLQRAALTQSALARERKDLQQQRERGEQEAAAAGAAGARPWNDPLAGERCELKCSGSVGQGVLDMCAIDACLVCWSVVRAHEEEGTAHVLQFELAAIRRCRTLASTHAPAGHACSTPCKPLQHKAPALQARVHERRSAARRRGVCAA